jgi:tetratricopeptide (TPR) repeat protein
MSRARVLRSGRRKGDYAEGRAGVVEAAETTLRLDPRRSGGYEALALLEPWGAYGARERLLQKALSASPNDPGALTEMCWFCWSVGRFGEALRLAEQASELDPLMAAARLLVAQMRAYVGDFAGCVRMHQELYRRWPGNFAILHGLLNCASTFGFWDEYRQGVAETGRFEGWQAELLNRTIQYGDALASEDPAPRHVLLEKYTAIAEKSGTLPLNYLMALSMLGLTEQALDLAERISFAHVFDPDGPLPSGSFPGTIMGPWSALVRTPRFIGLCDRLGLCAYWTESGRWPDCAEWAPYDFKAEVLGRAS